MCRDVIAGEKPWNGTRKILGELMFFFFFFFFFK